jgi:tungstate transport system ATP-binding protein
MKLYTLNNIRQVFAGRTVLDIDRLSIDAGYIHALLGPNGAGKTTLLDILAFLNQPAGGQLLFNEKVVDFADNDLTSLRKQVVLVDQHPIMFSTSASNNIEYGLKIRKMARTERQKTIDRVLEIVGLSHYRSAAAHQLSGGETQRLALARALALEPKVLLCDEPTASVDSENQGIIETLLQRINAELHTTIIFTTHDRVQAATLAQRTIVLEKGRPVAATFENSFTATVTPNDDESLLCNLHDQVKFVFPRSSEWRVTEKFHTGRLYLNPEKIHFRRPAATPQSEEEIAGTVILIMVEGHKIRMILDIGLRITVIMTKERYLQEQPAVGETLLLRPGRDGCSFMPGR